MKRTKIYALVAFAAALFAVACNNDDKIDDELNPNEAKRVAFVKEFAEVRLSRDLREAAEVAVTCIGLDHQSLDLSSATISDRAKVDTELSIEEITYPCALTITITITPKADFTPELNRIYNFRYWTKGEVWLADKDGKVLAIGDDTEEGGFSVTAKEDTPWNTLLNISPIVTSVRIVERADGSLEIED